MKVEIHYGPLVRTPANPGVPGDFATTHRIVSAEPQSRIYDVERYLKAQGLHVAEATTHSQSASPTMLLDPPKLKQLPRFMLVDPE